MSSYNTHTQLIKTLRWVFIGLTTVSLTACVFQKPAVTQASRMLASFNHVGVTTCNECHAITRPVGYVGKPAFDHSKNGGDADCSTCHLSSSANLGKTWAGGQFAHNPKPSSCVACHDVARPTSGSGFVSYNSAVPFDLTTHGGSMDCAVCHVSVNRFNVSSDWGGGSYTHPATLGSCIDCHAAQRPSGSVGPTGSVPFNHASNGGMGDCVSCHMNVPANLGVTWAGGNYSHNPRPATCMECHNSERPKLSVGDTTKPFDYTTHGGNMDCAVCHAATTTYTTVSQWAGGIFSHKVQGTAINTCIACHQTQRPALLATAVDATGATITNFDHLTQGSGDCAGCHQAALTHVTAATPNYSWVSTGLRYPSTLVGISAPDLADTDASVTTAVPTWSGTSITAVQTSTIAVPQTMNHLSIEVSSSDLSNCALCHSGYASGNFRPGYYHDSIATQPRTCADCHGSGTSYTTGALINGMPVGFVGSNGAGRNPVSPEMNHFAQTWAGAVHQTTSAFIQDCSVCHANPGGVWSGANFHTALYSASQSQPSTCLDCHANNRPSGAVPAAPSAATPTKFDHSYAQGDCATCHTAPTNTKASVPPSAALWAGGKYHPTAGVQTSCSGCHEAQRPKSTSGWVGTNVNAPFDYTIHAVGTDCVSCHSATSNFSAMSGWSGGVYLHSAVLTSTCTNCHSLPTTQWYSGAGLAGFNHAGVGDCAGCHAAALTNVINQGWTPSNAAWVGTGVGGTPSGLIGVKTIAVSETLLVSSTTPITSYRQISATSASTANLPLGILHSSSMIPAFQKDGTGALKCTNCHNAASIQNGYKNGQFHTDPATGVLWPTQPTQCRDCHQSTLPVGLVGTTLRVLNHAASTTTNNTVSGAAGDCATCHTNAGVSGGWLTGGAFHGKTFNSQPKTCSECHYSEVQPILTTITNHMNHWSVEVTQDCTTCHAQPTAGQIATAGYPTAALWAGGKFHSKVATQPATCTDCHSNERPSATTQSSVDSTQAVGEFMNHASSWAQKDCAVCHASEVKVVAGVATMPTSWLKSDSFHTGVATGVTSCKECHGLSNGSTVAGTGNTIPAGITNSSTNSSIGNVGVTITPYFSAPASGAAIPDQMSHLDANVTSRDCVSCHAVPSAGAGPSYAVWQQGKFHSNVATVDIAAGKCASCHANIMPNASFTTYNHTTLVSASGTIAVPGSTSKLSSDCSACHNKNIGVNWTGATGVTHLDSTGKILSTMTTCATCHAANRPATTVISPPTAAAGTVLTGTGTYVGAIKASTNDTYYHTAAVNGTADCSVCHTAVPGNAGVTWAGAKWNHTTSTGTTFASTAATPCMTCHKKHNVSVSKDCWGCHNTTAKIGSSWGQP